MCDSRSNFTLDLNSIMGTLVNIYFTLDVDIFVIVPILANSF